jgi:hypothetical protein
VISSVIAKKYAPANEINAIYPTVCCVKSTDVKIDSSDASTGDEHSMNNRKTKK